MYVCTLWKYIKIFIPGESLNEKEIEDFMTLAGSGDIDYAALTAKLQAAQ